MTKKTKTLKTPTARTVYEVRQNGQPTTIEVSSAADLAGELARLLDLDQYGSRAVAHTLHSLRASITAPTWTARRVGVLQFVPDDQAQPAVPAARRTAPHVADDNRTAQPEPQPTEDGDQVQP